MKTDDQLMSEIANAESLQRARDAFAELFERYGGVVLGYCTRLTNDKALAEDISQEIWMKVISEKTRYKAAGQFRAWILTVSRNACFNSIKSRSRFVDLQEDQFETELAAHLNADDDQARQDFVATLKTADENLLKFAFDSLPESQRVALSLLVIEELSYDQIAQAMGLNLANVKTLIHRARHKLKSSLSKRAFQ